MMKLHVSSSSIKVATTTGGLITLPNFNLNFPYCCRDYKWTSSSSFPMITAAKFVISHRNAVCYAESSGVSSSTVAAETKEGKEGESTAPAAKEDAAAAPAKPKPKPAAKAPVKALPEMIEEDVIPSLRSILETQEDIEELELFFKDNKLEGSFSKKGIPYTFWALFPDGTLTGPKGFSISSYGSTASSVEPFLVDEKKVTAKLLVFWVEKRLAAQGIIPVWTE
ncbi:hypothetical protein M8C21_031590 [Ambrosia artemisiifolia]|uniref:Uncharacterized protein n=1 Tax=Ambrosia artemisiifolia TaxID=4212 RepID=A0AAD5GFH5_AMBAR|nr:hypothetical protein M8C21_031590 [Ambrosia artemisiifolia]